MSTIEPDVAPLTTLRVIERAVGPPWPIGFQSIVSMSQSTCFVQPTSAAHVRTVEFETPYGARHNGLVGMSVYSRIQVSPSASSFLTSPSVGLGLSVLQKVASVPPGAPPPPRTRSQWLIVW